MAHSRIYRVLWTLFLVMGVLVVPNTPAAGDDASAGTATEKCTEGDTKCAPDPATVIVTKATEPASDVAFGFTSSIPGFTPNLGGGESASTEVAAGRYTLTELPTAGWELGSISCEGATRTRYEMDTGTAVIRVASGATVECTFTNLAEPEPEPATIVIEKVTDPGDTPLEFAFTTSVPGWNPSLGSGETATIEVDPGTYSLAEDLARYATKGWRLTDLTCTDPDAVIDIADPRAGGTATVEVSAGETVRCTFTNTEYCPFNGKLVVHKVTEPSGADAVFDFQSDVLWKSDVPWGTTLGDGESDWTWAQPGVYTVAELIPEGWRLSDVACDDPDAVVDLASGTATVDIGEGEIVNCTFTNEEIPDEPEPGTIVINKVTDPTGADETFAFLTIHGGDAIVAEDELGDGESATHEVIAGTYEVVEMDEEGWRLIDISCDDPDAVVDEATKTAAVTVGEGEIVSCTFTNEEIPDEPEPGTIVINKVTDPTGADEVFDFVTLAGEDLVLAEDELADGESATHAVTAGEYTIVERDEMGWELTDIACDDPDAVVDLANGAATVAVAEGEIVTCTFTNLEIPDEPEPAMIVIEKATDPEGSTETFGFTTTLLGWNPVLSDGERATEEVDPGIYTVVEAELDGWDLTSITCDAGVTIDLDERSVTIDVAASETVTCTFLNTQAIQPGGIGDYVWNDANRNGIQDRGEKGVAGVRVNLYSAGGAVLASTDSASGVEAQTAANTVFYATTRTDANGEYMFDDVPAGNYVVEFTGLPEGYRFTKPFVGTTNTIDSDADLTSGRTPVMVIPEGHVDLTCDAGVYLVFKQGDEGEELPVTGMDVQAPLWAGTLLLAAGAAMLLGVKLRKEH